MTHELFLADWHEVLTRGVSLAAWSRDDGIHVEFYELGDDLFVEVTAADGHVLATAGVREHVASEKTILVPTARNAAASEYLYLVTTPSVHVAVLMLAERMARPEAKEKQ